MVTSQLNGPRCQERYIKQNQNKADRKIGVSPVVELRDVRGNTKIRLWNSYQYTERCRYSHRRSWSWMVQWSPTRPSRTSTKKRCPFHHRGLECKSRKSRDTWSNRKVWPWCTKWSRSKSNRVLPRECTGHSKQILLTTHETILHMDINRWSILIRLIICFAVEDGKALYSQQKQEQEMTVIQIMNFLLPNSDLNWRSRENH